MAVQGDISYGLAIGAGQSVRRNAGDTAFEAYTPSAGGLTWGTSVAAGSGVALTLTSADLGGGNAFTSFVHTASGTLTACTTTQNTQSVSRTYTLTSGSVTDNFIGTLFSRTNVTTGAGGTLLAQGSVVNIAGTDTQTAGTLTPSYHLLKLDPSLRSTGSSILVNVPNSVVTAPTNGHVNVVLGATNTVVQTLVKLDTGGSAADHYPLKIRSLQGGAIGYADTAEQAINTYRGIYAGVSTWNNNSTFSSYLAYLTNSQNAGSGVNSGVCILNRSTEISIDGSGSPTRGAGLTIEQIGAGGTSIAIYGDNNVNSSSGGLVNYTISNTQSGATVIEKIDLGTSSQGHTGILIHAYNASVSSKAININQSTTGTGYGIYMQGATNNTGTFGFFNNGSTDNYLFRSFSSSTGTLFGQILNGELLMQSASLSNRTAEFMYSHSSRINEAASGTVADNYNAHYFKRTNRQQTAGGTMTAAGSVLKLENIATQIAGTLTDTVDVLLLDQDTDSTGNIINARAGGTTKFAISATGALTTTPLTSGAVGFLNIPQNSQSAAYTTVAADSGKHILHPSADTTARTFTIDSNANVAYPIGTSITFVNQNSAGVVTIAITSDTMRLAGAGTTGSRTLAANGIATAIKVTSTEWIINGTGLT